jgi:hypothetical protein
MTDLDDRLEEEEDERLVLGDLLSHVLDKGVVISGDVTISVADIDLIRVGLDVYITGVESLERALRERSERPLPDADLSLLRAPGAK